MEANIKEQIKLWANNATEDKDLVNEYQNIKDDEDKLLDAFFKELSFGTGGLRGVLGFGPNRMNIYNIRKATQGLANYLKKEYSDKKEINVSVGYDSRIKSDVFAKETAIVLAKNGIKVNIFKTLLPVPVLSFATRELHCQAGVMITASHNPSKYNGYKVYNQYGCQITDNAASLIYKEISSISPFEVRTESFDAYLDKGLIAFIDDNLLTKFINRVKQESVLSNQIIDRNVKIIYSPLHGTGLIPVTRILKETGFENVIVVEEQRLPDGNFTTCPFPNPEVREAMNLGIEYARKNNADLVIATDPDCDRVGIAVKNGNDYALLTGNQTGVLLLNYICELRKVNNTLPVNPIIAKTIVTTDMADNIAKYHGCTVKSLLTGFKYIGEYIGELEKNNNEKSYIFGFEESYGYLTGTYVRDKDAVDGAFLIAEMFAYYKTKGISLIEKLNELYKQFGYYLNTLDNFCFEGATGFSKMKELIEKFKKPRNEIANINVKQTNDYSNGIENLPKSNVIKFHLENGSTVTLRPSGTEPKLKLYCSIKADNEEKANHIYKEIKNYFDRELSN